MSPETISKIIGMAWADRITFDEIEKSTGLTEAQVIKLMRSELKPGSFRRWRKRVTGRKTKHRKVFEESQRRSKVTKDDF